MTTTPQKKVAPCGKIYLNSRRRFAYRYEHGEFQIRYFTGRKEWTKNLRLEYHYDKHNPDHLPPEQWLARWCEIGLELR